MKPVKLVGLVYVDGRITPATKENRKGAAVVLSVDPSQITDNFAFARLGEALKFFTTQSQWPPALALE